MLRNLLLCVVGLIDAFKNNDIVATMRHMVLMKY